jgi:16S rRNA (guanine527-N7)-methyltransferase
MDVGDRIAELVERYRLPGAAAEQFERVLAALAAEPDPHTTVSAPAEAVDQHIADSLSALDLPDVCSASRIVDIGAGAGFPGLPLAAALPEAEVDLLEASRRKVAVIERLAAAAGLENARALPFRAEEWGSAEGRNAYDLATARAVAPLAVLVEYAAPLLRPGGALIAWKGHRDPEEEGSGSAAAEMVGLRPISVTSVEPFVGVRDLNLYVYSKQSETPGRFPRRPGAAAKRPLA